MSQTFLLRSIRDETKNYGEGAISIEETSNLVEVFEQRRRWFRESRELVKRFPFDAQTEIQFKGTKVFVANLELETTDEDESKKIAYIIWKPRYEALRRTRERTLEQIDKAAREFLTSRAETLIWAQNLRTRPRQILLEASASLRPDTQDPIAELLQMRSMQLNGSFQMIEKTVAEISYEIKEPWINTYYASLYGIGMIQNALFTNDESLLGFGSRLISQICSKSFSDLRGPVEEVTKRLLTEVFESLTKTVLSSYP